jgi:signal transduction histidine kinase
MLHCRTRRELLQARLVIDWFIEPVWRGAAPALIHKMASSDSSAGAPKRPPATSNEELAELITTLERENLKLHGLAEHHSASLSHLVHELRTPLTSILGFAEIMLSQEELTEAQRNFCERIQNSAQQLQRNLSQLSDLARAIAASDAGQS